LASSSKGHRSSQPTNQPACASAKAEEERNTLVTNKTAPSSSIAVFLCVPVSNYGGKRSGEMGKEIYLQNFRMYSICYLQLFKKKKDNEKKP
jgi:hypothetical protein